MQIPWFRTLELKTIDWRFEIRGELPVNEPIVIIAIDDNSIEEFGNWPWSRRYHIQLIKKLRDYKAKVIAFDVYFDTEEDKRIDSDFSKILGEDTILASFYVSFNDPRFGTIKRLIEPLSIFSSKTKVGLVNPIYDEDGFIRRFGLTSKIFDKEYVSFPTLIVSTYLSLNPLEYIKTAKIPKDSSNLVYINYKGGLYKFPTFSYSDVLKENIPKEIFKDKIVLIGATTEALHDTHFTPFYHYIRKGSTLRLSKMPGVEIHANSIATLLNKKFLCPLNEGIPLYLITLIFIAIPIIPFKKVFSGYINLILILALIIVYIILCNQAFINWGWILPIIAPIFSIIFSYIFSLVYNFLKEQREKRELKSVFQRFVPSSVVDIILSNPGQELLQTKRQWISVMFADIRNFTYYSDILTPEEITKILNEYFTVATEIIFKYEGTVDKFLGDAIMALFGAPIFYSNAPIRAINTAIEIQEALNKLREGWKEKGYPPFEVGMGITTGEAVAGTIGSTQRMEYTAIGAVVNLAERLESIAKGGEILVCEETFNFAKDYFNFEDLGFIKVKGKEEPVHVYKVIGKKE
ncbi:MAG: adenylate/guanylate cyclase domain-containing protein [Dictyoglomus sp. NZ13-RE01]|nr:MAG: adenylate/guanylate cyclase domain-containing protein [Dictyoglomus sp. NZ13-RE01]